MRLTPPVPRTSGEAMYLYRYSSGQRRPNKKPMLDAYFIPPSYASGYDDPCILTAHSTIAKRGFPVSNLKNRGGDDVVLDALEDHRWIAVEIKDVPPILPHNGALKLDQYPHASQWFRTEVDDDYLENLEALILHLPPEVRERKPVEIAKTNPYLVRAAVFLALAVAMLFIHNNMPTN